MGLPVDGGDGVLEHDGDRHAPAYTSGLRGGASPRRRPGAPKIEPSNAFKRGRRPDGVLPARRPSVTTAVGITICS